MKYKTIIWDWNGTLLNDVNLCIECMNIMLNERQLPLLSLERYRNIFGFPVIEYYKKLGFDFTKEDFTIPAHHFIDLYKTNLPKATLHDNVINTLESLQAKAYKQIIISAKEDEFLKKSVHDFGIANYFDGIYGINDHLAKGKTEMAMQLAAKKLFEPQTSLLIGDTLHDAEMAEQLNCDCIIIPNGHQAAHRFAGKNVRIVTALSGLLTLLQ